MSGLPTPEESLLLRAALGDGVPALAAWEAWRARVSLEALRGDAVGLLPLLYRNLRRLGVDAQATARYASVYRHTWAANRLMFQATARVLAALEGAGLETLVLKGAALALAHYRDAGARPMGDVDVLVRPAGLRQAIALLGRAGFRTSDGERALALGHAMQFYDGHGRSVDLHWHVAGDATHAGADDALWRAARPLTVEGVRTRQLAPTDLLYHVLVHADASHTSHLRWVADAAMVLRGGEVDPARLAALAGARRSVLPVRDGLRYLVDELGAPVAPGALAALAREPVAWIDRLEHAGARAGEHYPFGRVLVGLWCRHRRSTEARGIALALAFPLFLTRYYGVATAWDLPAVGLRRGVRRAITDGLW